MVDSVICSYRDGRILAMNATSQVALAAQHPRCRRLASATWSAYAPYALHALEACDRGPHSRVARCSLPRVLSAYNAPREQASVAAERAGVRRAVSSGSLALVL
jgi:hypothetical protein